MDIMHTIDQVFLHGLGPLQICNCHNNAQCQQVALRGLYIPSLISILFFFVCCEKILGMRLCHISACSYACRPFHTVHPPACIVHGSVGDYRQKANQPDTQRQCLTNPWTLGLILNFHSQVSFHFMQSDNSQLSLSHPCTQTGHSGNKIDRQLLQMKIRLITYK